MPGGYQVPLIGGASLPAPQETVARVGCERLQNTKDATDAKALLETRSLFDHKSSQSHSKDGEFRECDALCRSTFAHLAKILHGLASCFSSGHTAPVVCWPSSLLQLRRSRTEAREFNRQCRYRTILSPSICALGVSRTHPG